MLLSAAFIRSIVSLCVLSRVWIDVSVRERKRECQWLETSSSCDLEEHHRRHQDDDQRNEKISNKSSFGIIDIAEATSDRIIVIVDTACLIHDGACR